MSKNYMQPFAVSANYSAVTAEKKLSNFHYLFFLLVSIVMLLSIPFTNAHAASFNSVTSGVWADGATWGNASPGVSGVDYPGASDTATVFNTHTITLTSNTKVTRAVFKPGSHLATGTFDLTVSSRYINHSSTSGSGRLELNGTVNVGGNGTWASGDVLIEGSTTFVPNSTFRVTSADMVMGSGATVSNSGRVYITGSLTGHVDQSSTFTNEASALVSISGSVLTDGVLVTSAAGNRVIYESGSNTIKTPTPASYEKLNLYGNATKTISDDIAVNNDIILTGTTNIDIGTNILELGGRIFFYTSNANPIALGDGTLNMTASTAQSLPGTYELNGFIVDNSAGVTISGAAMTIKDSLKVISGTLTTNGRITLTSDASGTARVAETTGTISGDVTVQRFVDSGTEWHVVAMPITGGTLDDWGDDTPMTGFPTSHYPGFGWTSVYFYDETLPGLKDAGFVAPTNMTNSVTNGEGIWLYFENMTLDVTGPLNSGDKVMTITYTPDSGFDEDGWNLAGNPFASPIRWGDFTHTGIEDQYWIYDPATGNFANWNEATQTGTLGANGIIPSGQAFEVHSTAGGPTLTVPQTSKATTAPAFKHNLTNTLSIRLYKEGKKLSDETLVQNMPITYKTFEQGLDALKRFPPVKQQPAISSLSEDGYSLGINTLDFTDPQAEVYFKLHYMQEGTYTLGGWEGYEGCDNLWLEDLLTGAEYNLCRTNEITFDATPGSEEPRFRLRFGKESLAGMNEADPSWNVYQDQGTVVMNITEGVDAPSMVQAITLDGKTVETIQLNAGVQTAYLNLPGSLARGGLMLRWLSNNGETIKTQMLMN